MRALAKLAAWLAGVASSNQLDLPPTTYAARAPSMAGEPYPQRHASRGPLDPPSSLVHRSFSLFSDSHLSIDRIPIRPSPWIGGDEAESYSSRSPRGSQWALESDMHAHMSSSPIIRRRWAPPLSTSIDLALAFLPNPSHRPHQLYSSISILVKVNSYTAAGARREPAMEFTPAHGGGAEDSERARVGGGGAAWVEKEHMFEKVVTPSDVGKLNRLVIPKQHAERYFPALDSSATAAPGTGKCLVLSFEDRAGKAWRFRYSYWNSSQSYVMTKGWSRFVKEKRLGAGDTVLFSRGHGAAAARARLFIDFRRRRQDLAFLQHPPPPLLGSQRFMPLPSVPIVCPWQQQQQQDYYGAYGGGAPASSRHVLFLRPQQVPSAAVVLASVPVSVAASTVEDATRSKRVRLFGVNLDCPTEEGEDGAREDNRTASTLLQQLPSPSSSTSSSTAGKDVCSLDLGL
ncbi:hypothetical protein HU200_035258 [Digitaria exilis]|uniref:TF-B3 domain-containing protein n=1 Tax=Digitaria exilis TaxID=1010633 RepID=A0A835BR41_9POAL|nr:hypothetical protein HU200_035258 [Digitaria exilis]